MPIQILATRNCNHRPILEKRLRTFGIDYEVVYVDDRPDWISKYRLLNSPNILYNGVVVFRARFGKPLPTEAELKDIVQKVSEEEAKNEKS